jgi:phage terminase large subunit
LTDNIADQFADQLAAWRLHPARMVRELFGVEPDPWQEDALEAFPHSPRLAMKACNGPGKTAVLGWIGWNYLLTRPRPKIAATSISAANLADGLWTEMAKWQHVAPVLKNFFTWTKTRIFHNDAPEEWFMSARTWSQSADATPQADTLAGLHADYILFLIDESGGTPDAIMPTAEAALSGSPKEAHIVQAGNPIALSGPLYRACTTSRNLWYVVEITGDPDDPKRSTRIPIEYAREQIAQYGRDNPWVLVNIFGQFPPSSLNVLIGPDEVRAAMTRFYREHELGAAAKVIGVDVALYGDDASVIASRHGL